MRRLLLYCALLGFLSISIVSYSQTQGVLSKKWYGNWSIGIAGGPNMYFGHLSVNDYWPVSENIDGWRYAGSFYLMRQFSHVFALRGQVLYGELAGSKRSFTDGTPYNMYFDGTVLEYNLNATFNLSNMLFRYKPKRIFFIYGTVGVGLSNWNTTIKDLATHEPVGDPGSAGKWSRALVVPAGLGAYFNIADRVNLGFEWTLRTVNSEILNASKTPVGFQYDMYSFLSLNLVFNLNRRNPVELNAVQATMPPVAYPKPLPDTDTKPVSTTPLSVPDSITASKADPSQPVELSPEQMVIMADTVMPDTTMADNTSAQPDVPEEVTNPQPYQLPGLEADLFYRVQIFSSKTGQRTARSIQSYFKLNLPVEKELTEGYYRYYIGEFEDEKEAKQFVASLRTKPGMKGAFAVKYINGRRELTHPK